MSYTFYRKYRPKRFSEVIGQESIVKTLEQSLVQNRLSHAYLFTGPRGTGKTTLARLFAMAVNCSKRKGPEPCGACPACTLQGEGRSLDVIEIDGASYTQVDNIRALRDTLALSPTVASHKVYIIDEAHMLSLSAWNALLKTLEEPPAHVIFILATTNVNKVPETILSRVMRFDLARFPVDKIVEKLARIAKAEKLKIDKEALFLIARSAEGGMRDAEALFTQIATLEESPIDTERVSILLGIAHFSSLHDLLDRIRRNDLLGALDLVARLKTSGLNLLQFTRSLLGHLRTLLLASLDSRAFDQLTSELTPEEKQETLELGQALGSNRIVQCLETFQQAVYDMRTASIPELPLEIALAKLIALPPKSTDSGSTLPSHKNSESRPKETRPRENPEPTPKKEEVRKTEKEELSKENREKAIDLGLVKERWSTIVAQAKELNASVGVALAAAIPTGVHDNRLVVTVKYPFHRERLEEKRHQLTLAKAFDTILGFRVPLEVSVNSQIQGSAPSDSRPAIIDQALEMLGGKLISENS